MKAPHNDIPGTFAGPQPGFASGDGEEPALPHRPRRTATNHRGIDEDGWRERRASVGMEWTEAVPFAGQNRRAKVGGGA